MATLRALCLFLALALPWPVAAETYLLMAEEDGCIWCARWTRDIGPIYPKTAEGKVAPLRRYDLHSETPQGVTFAAKVRFTPTFVLVHNGAEVGRIEGYPGEDFFWGLLSRLFERGGIDLDPTG